ncbi:uncharacterized protein LOC111049768, partial [Nilaparvata lugens]|uniref:uncharacterized protein LOC111049768 n=1 Tax=Nilaparvata lugens TaxID=108931 RepID=UPI00193DD7E1
MSCRNVEIKAKVKDLPSFLLKCEEVSQSVGEVIKQEDFFFNAKEGRLKLRKFEGGAAELIFYDRPNMEGPKLSEYEKCSVSDGSKLQAVLSRALGVSGEVRKYRHLFLVGQTRIHVDQVENLGSFMELE